MRESIDSRRKTLTNIAKAKLEDYWPIATVAPSIWWLRFNAAIVEDWSAKLWRRLAPTTLATLFRNRRSGGNSELRKTFERKGAKDGMAGLLSIASTFDRQCP